MNTELPSVPNSNIGDNLKANFEKYLALGAELDAATDGAYHEVLNNAVAPLQKAIGAVSVIGQVKAGKTSLMNSFIGKPGFLPSDVNPWTAVVTSMFFDRPDGPVGGAKFLFFNKEKWQEFGSRSGRLAEMASSIPGGSYDPNEIAIEIEQMRNRAAMRLGDMYQTLLGKQHAFDTINSEVLSRYICAGDDPEGKVRNPEAGRFADITREANVFFDKARFGFPLKVIDTPGLNDPLLIREEITLQCLEYSDIFILVLSAHQAFSSTDLYLLRVLNALRLDRLVVYVNRVDELTDPVKDIPEIRRHVENMLSQENPDVKIPILFGSAIWAEFALTGVADEPINSDDCDYFLTQNSLEGSLEKARTTFQDETRARAWVASGVPALDLAVSEFLEDGVGEIWLKSTRIDMQNAIQLICSDTNSQIDSLARQRDKLNGINAVKLHSSFADEQEKVDELKVTVEEQFTLFGGKLGRVINETWLGLQRGLHERTEEFITQEAKRFSDYSKNSDKKKTESWTCDPAPLRRSLNDFFRKEYLVAQTHISARMEEEAKALTEFLVKEGFAEAANVQLNTASLQSQAPNTTALSKVVSFDLSVGFWKGWLNRFRAQEDPAKQLGNMIRGQFVPIERELLESVTKKFIDTSGAAIENFKELQNTLLAARVNQLARSNDNSMQNVAEIEEKLKILRNRAVICSTISAQLTEMSKQVA